jgi:RNA polymerase sigma-70 factor (ECF subfamily)
MSVSGASDEFGALVDGARGGSPEALASLYRAHGAALYRLAYRLTGTREEAEDVLHDVFVGLPEALGRYAERGNLTGWLKRVTARVALGRVRSRKRRCEVPLELAGPGSEPLADAEDIALEVAVSQLPDRLRDVIVLKEIEGYSHREVADLLGISVVASRVRAHRGLARLRQLLEDGR